MEGFNKGLVWRVLGGTATVLLALALGHYHPTDPTPFATGNVAPAVRNVTGGSGAWVAGALHTLFGFGAWAFPMYFLWECWPIEGRRLLRRIAWLVMALVAWTTLGAFGNMTWAAVEGLPAVETRIGGWFGIALWGPLRRFFGPWGLPIILMVLGSLSAMILAPALMRWVIKGLARLLGEKLWPFAKATPGKGMAFLTSAIRRPWLSRKGTVAEDEPVPDIAFGDVQISAERLRAEDEALEAYERARRETEALRRNGAALDPEVGLPPIYSVCLDAPAATPSGEVHAPHSWDGELRVPPTGAEIVIKAQDEMPTVPLPRPDLLRNLPEPPPARPPVVQPKVHVDGFGNVVEQQGLGLTEPTPRRPLPEMPPSRDLGTRRIPSQQLPPVPPRTAPPVAPPAGSRAALEQSLALVDRMDLPPRRLFDMPRPGGRLDPATLEDTRALIQQKLTEFKVRGQVTGMQPGPVVTVYEFQPDAGVPLSKVMGMEDDLALGLQVEKVRIDRIPGRNLVGIEVPNPRRETITFREVIDSPSFRDPSHKDARSLLTLALGKDIAGAPVVADLASMPHLLIGGSTGSGKSVGVNAMICSILLRALPHEAKLILIDPKMVELGIYEDVPHLWAPVVTDMKEAGRVLKWVVSQMEDRYRRLALLSVRNLEGFNARIAEAGGCIDLSDRTPNPRWVDRPAFLEALPYVVVVIDELADLMMVCRSEVEESIARIAQKARAVGIHLVLATQRPSVDIVTGVIKANLPSRLSYRVNTKIDSRTILDSGGGEQLLGKGDALFLAPGQARPRRIHAPFLTEDETIRLIDWLKERGKPDYNMALLGAMEADEEIEAAQSGGGDEGDDVYARAVAIVKRERKASTSLLQRKLNLGYGRAARLIDRMEEEGLIGPDRGAGKPREVYAPEEV